MESEALNAKLSRMEERLAALERENRQLRKACDVHEIQNVMSLHEYFHSAGRHEEELDAIWARKADDVAFEEALFQARFVGRDAIRAYYVDFMKNTLFKSARELTKTFLPRVEEDPGGCLAFGLSYMHTLTTPVIEVADDRETAKGAWVSPGFITMPTMTKLQAYWHWDRYGVDFIREDGAWKVWHFFVGREFTTPYEKSWVDTALDGEEAYEMSLLLFREWSKAAGPHGAQRNAFESYSPFKVATLQPRLPAPYRTFSETFSY